VRNRKTSLVLSLTFSFLVLADAGRDRPFDTGWRFHRGDIAGAEAPDFDDAEWRIVDVPHDWSIEDLPHSAGKGSSAAPSPLSPKSPGGADTGFVEGGVGWYRKSFTLENADRGKRTTVRFDGVYMDADFWINGIHLGNHPYGYTSFSFDLTSHLNSTGKRNVLAVRIRNLGKNSRWYSGSGIYRHVWLTVTGSVYIPLWGVFVTTPRISPEKAVVRVATEAAQAGSEEIETEVRVAIHDPAGVPVGRAAGKCTISPRARTSVTLSIPVTRPRLWSPEHPDLYRARVELWSGGKRRDGVSVVFGIRRLEFSARDGFRLNGKSVLLRGACVHHDNGPLGSAAIDRAEERRVELLKANGFNAIRTSHNPPSSEFLSACDRLGMLVIDEAFDMWERPKRPQDYHRFFRSWWRRDLTSMVKRDRNHPSIILWSVGNEIPERADPPGLKLTGDMVSLVKTLDPTRPVTAAICEFWDQKGRPWKDTAAAFARLDVGGYNYQWRKYEPDHRLFPDRIMAGTESFPREALENWNAVEKYPWVIGDFVWTGIDYLGESGIGHAVLDNSPPGFLRPFPWHISNCGDIDICGFKKPPSFYRDVVWRRRLITMAVHAPLPPGRKERVSAWGWPDERRSWTWPGAEGKPLEVTVYTRCEAVRLELNGKVVGEAKVPEKAKLRARFHVTYSPGLLRAVGLRGGKKIAECKLETAGAPARIRLSPDRETVRADRNDLAYVTVQLLDGKGRPVPAPDILVRFSLSGPGSIAAVGNGDPRDPSSYRLPERRTFRGRCLVILRPEGRPGVLTLKARAEGLPEAEVRIRIE